MKEKIKKIIEDLKDDVALDMGDLENYGDYKEEDLDDLYYNTETTEEQLLALIHCNRKVIKMLEEIEK